jgi:hypothetical protein
MAIKLIKLEASKRKKWSKIKKMIVKKILLSILISLWQDYPLDSAGLISQVLVTPCSLENCLPDFYSRPEAARLGVMITEFSGKDDFPKVFVGWPHRIFSAGRPSGVDPGRQSC